METVRISRGKVIVVGSSALASLVMSKVGALAGSARPNLTATLANYSDGVGLVDQYGASLIRLHWTSDTVWAEGGGQLWTISKGAVRAGFSYMPVGGVSITLPRNGYGKYVTPYGSGNSTVPQQNDAPINSYDSEMGGQQTVARTPHEWPHPGGGGGPQPHSAQCVVAIVNLIGAALALAGALAEFLGGPITWGPAVWSLLGAAAYYSAADAALQLECQ